MFLGGVFAQLRVFSRTALCNSQSLARPHLEYAATAWSPHTSNNIKKVEMVQRRAARYVCNRWHNTSSVSEMVGHLGWESLAIRRNLERLQDISHHRRFAPPRRFAPIFKTFHPGRRDDLPQFKTFRPPVRRFTPMEDVSPPMWDFSPPIKTFRPLGKMFRPMGKTFHPLSKFRHFEPPCETFCPILIGRFAPQASRFAPVLIGRFTP